MTTSPLAASARLPLRAPPYEPETERSLYNQAFAGLSPQNLRLALAHQPQLARAFQELGHVILFKCKLPEREREIAIIRTGALARSEYEWGMHVSIYAERCGLTQMQIADLTQGDADSDRWTPRERLIVRMVDELHRHSTVADTTWTELSEHWPNDQIVELILSAGFYRMAALFLNTAAVPLETGSARFPPGLAQAGVPGAAGE